MYSLKKRIVSVQLFKLACLALTAQFTFIPHSSAAPGDLYVTDLANGSVMIYKPNGTVSTFATGLTNPQGITFDQAKNLYVVDAGDGGAGNGVVLRYDLGTATPVEFLTGLDNPTGVTNDGAYLLVSESGSDRITRATLNGSGMPVIFQSGITEPMGLASHVDPIVGSGLSRYIAFGTFLRQVRPDSTVLDVNIGSTTRGVAVDDSGNVFVGSDNGEINKIVGGTTTTLFASVGDQPTGMDFRPGKFNGDMDRVGFLYVADPITGIISQIGQGGVVSTFVDTGTAPNFLVFERNDPAPTPTPTPSPSPSPQPTPNGPGKALNISSRVDVETGDNVAIGGFIVTGGTVPKTVAIRAIGPSLASPGVANPLSDPVLELHDSNGDIIAMNNDWMENSATDQGIIVERGLAPVNNLESVLIASLSPLDASVVGSGMYTAVVRGNNDVTGIGLVEIYDLDDPSVESNLGNLSTRGLVGTDDKVLIGGLIVGPLGTTPPTEAEFVLRAIGPSLANVTPPVADSLADPILELYNANGDIIDANDNWGDGPNAADIEALGLNPTGDKESAILDNLIAGFYTAIVRGKDNSVGVGLVEVYRLAPAMAK